MANHNPVKDAEDLFIDAKRSFEGGVNPRSSDYGSQIFDVIIGLLYFSIIATVLIVVSYKWIKILVAFGEQL